MSSSQMPGGRRRIDDDTVRWAMMFAGLFLIVFFLLVARLFFDAREGKAIPLKPVRDPSKIIRSVIK